MVSKALYRGKSVGDLAPWITGYYHYDRVLNEHYICNEESLVRYDVIAETVGQFIGLVDKNGKNIFFGDVVKDRWGRIMTIVYHNFRFQFYCDKEKNNFLYADLLDWAIRDKTSDYELTGEADVEVMGNVYDSPNLVSELRSAK